MKQLYRFLALFKKELFNNSFLRFLLVSGLNAAFGYGMFAFLLVIGLADYIALFVSTICGIAFNFKTISTLVFQNSNHQLIFKFLVVYSIIYTLNLLGIKMLKLQGYNSYFSGAIMLIPIGLFGYILNRYFVFNKPNRTV